MIWASVLDTVSWVSLIAGGAFFLIGAIGLKRMPDVFTRMHAVSVSETLGVGLLTLGMLAQAPDIFVAAKLLMILAVLLMTGPVATHALARAALQDEMRPLISNQKGVLRETTPKAAVTAFERAAKSPKRRPPSKR